MGFFTSSDGANLGQAKEERLGVCKFVGFVAILLSKLGERAAEKPEADEAQRRPNSAKEAVAQVRFLQHRQGLVASGRVVKSDAMVAALRPSRAGSACRLGALSCVPLSALSSPPSRCLNDVEQVFPTGGASRTSVQGLPG